jgi:hypothetical protein
MRESSRRRYRAVGFEKVDFGKLSKEVEGSKVVFAVDVGKELFAGTVVVDKKELCRFRWEHPRQTADVVRGITCVPSQTAGRVVGRCMGTSGEQRE